MGIGHPPIYLPFKKMEASLKKNLNPKVLGILLAISAGQSVAIADPSTNRQSEEVLELMDAGYLKVDNKTGKIVATKELFEILKDAGVLKEGKHSGETDGGCSGTVGGETAGNAKMNQ